MANRVAMYCYMSYTAYAYDYDAVLFALPSSPHV